MNYRHVILSLLVWWSASTAHLAVAQDGVVRIRLDSATGMLASYQGAVVECAFQINDRNGTNAFVSGSTTKVERRDANGGWTSLNVKPLKFSRQPISISDYPTFQRIRGATTVPGAAGSFFADVQSNRIVGIHLSATGYLAAVSGKGVGVIHAENVTTTGPPPVVRIPWEQRLTRQMFFFSAPNYYWPDASQAQVDATLDAILAAGLDGPSFELCNGKQANGLVGKATVEANIKAYARWDAGCKARGLVAHIAFLNSNYDWPKYVGNSSWRGYVDQFFTLYGTSNKIVLPVSERDPRTPKTVVDTIVKAVKLRIPYRHYIGYGSTVLGGAFHERHYSKVSSIESGDYLDLWIPDNGITIEWAYGPKWRSTGGTPNLDHIGQIAEVTWEKGVSGGIYSFSQLFDKAGLAAAAASWGGANTAPTGSADGQLISIKANGRDREVAIKADLAGWPIYGDKKPIIAELYIKGVQVDSVSTDNLKTGRKTVANAFGRGEHSIAAKKDEILPAQLKSKKTKKVTNVLKFAWPFETTPMAK